MLRKFLLNFWSIEECWVSDTGFCQPVGKISASELIFNLADQVTIAQRIASQWKIISFD